MKNTFLKIGVRLGGKVVIPDVPFTETYFLEDALRFRQELKIPLIYVGGLISGEKINEVLNLGFEFVAMARALIKDPGFIKKLKSDISLKNECDISNYCIARMYSKETACHHDINNLPDKIQKEIDKNKYFE